MEFFVPQISARNYQFSYDIHTRNMENHQNYMHWRLHDAQRRKSPWELREIIFSKYLKYTLTQNIQL